MKVVVAIDSFKGCASIMDLESAMNKKIALDLIRKKTQQIFRLIKVSNQI